MTGRRYFTPQVFGFLRELEKNNEREWFHANKSRYEECIRQPALDFITDFAAPLAEISPHFVADSRTVGGSLFRIQRDTRFSKDKTPYKTNTGVHFRHEQAKDAHAPGFYLHLEPRNCFFGAGLWRPEPKVAYAIRQFIADNADEWVRVRDGLSATGPALDGERLVRPPKGFDADDPLIDDLKRKDFIAVEKLPQSEVTRSDLVDAFAARCRSVGPFVSFLCAAVGVKY